MSRTNRPDNARVIANAVRSAEPGDDFDTTTEMALMDEYSRHAFGRPYGKSVRDILRATYPERTGDGRGWTLPELIGAHLARNF